MGDKKGLSFPLIIITVVIAWAVFKQFDSQNLRFEKPALAIVYILTLIMCLYFILTKPKQK